MSKYDPTPDEWMELLDNMRDAAEDGQLLCAMVMVGDTDECSIALRGPFSMLEIATRSVREEIARVMSTRDPSAAKRVRQGLAPEAPH